MFKKRDQVLLSEAYDRVVLEEGIKDRVLAGLVGLMAITSSQGAGNKNVEVQIQQLVQRTINIAQLKKIGLEVIDEMLREHQAILKELQQYDQEHRGGRVIEAMQDLIQTLQRLKQDIQDTNDGEQVDKLIDNAYAYLAKNSPIGSYAELEGLVKKNVKMME